MGCVGREEEHAAFVDDYIFEGAVVDDFEHHGAFVLVEPFGGFVDVVVGAGVGSSYNLFNLLDVLILESGCKRMNIP